MNNVQQTVALICLGDSKFQYKSVWELGVLDLDFLFALDFVSSIFASFGVYVGTTWRLAAEGEIDFQTAMIDSNESFTLSFKRMKNC